MANGKKPVRTPEIKEDELVRALVPDPEDVPESTLVIGYLGRSEDDDVWRIYVTPTLENYVEVRRQDILKTLPLGGDDDPLRGTAVWLRKSARVKQARTRTREVQASFLQGSVATGVRRRGGTSATPFGLSPFFVLRTTGGGTIGSFLNPPCAYGPHHSVALSCVPEFCEFVPATWLPDEVACTWEAECP